MTPNDPPPYCAVCGRAQRNIGMPLDLTICIGQPPSDPGCLSLVRGLGPLFFHRQSEIDPTLPPEILKGAEQVRAQVKAAVMQAQARH